jgi:hypothetical protein
MTLPFFEIFTYSPSAIQSRTSSKACRSRLTFTVFISDTDAMPFLPLLLSDPYRVFLFLIAPLRLCVKPAPSRRATILGKFHTRFYFPLFVNNKLQTLNSIR